MVAVAIPVFTGSLNKAKEAADNANARAMYGQLVSDYLDNNSIDDAPDKASLTGKGTVTVGNVKYDFSDQLSALSIDTSGAPSVTITTNGTPYAYGTSN